MTAKVKEHVLNYGHTTSVKGVSKIFKSKSVCLKILWSIAFLTGLTTGLYLLINLLIKYFSYTTVVKVSSCTGCHPPFPDVTLCNVYPLGMNNDFEEDHPGKVMTFLQYRSLLQDLANITNITEIEKKLSLSEEQLVDMFGLIYALGGYLENIDIKPLIQWLEHKPEYEGLVNKCQWYDWQSMPYSKENCMASSRYYIKSEDFQICTTIHINDSHGSSSNEEVKGFEALLYLNRYNDIFMPDYTQNILRTQASGVRVVIHPPNTFPETQQGFNIPSGHEVEIRLKAEEIVLEPAPYSDCTNKEKLFDDGTGDDEKLIDYHYSTSVSRALCKQQYFINKCGCFHHTLPIPKQLKLMHYDMFACIRIDDLRNITNAADIDIIKFLTKLKCVTYDIDDEVNLDKQCFKQERCNQLKYSYQVQQSPWPDTIYMLEFYCKFISADRCSDLGFDKVSPEFKDHFDYFKPIVEMMTINESMALTMLKSAHQQENLIAKNFIQLKVLFDGPELMTYTAIPSVTLEFLFGSLGGILNLWIGVTFFTLVEWADLCLIIVRDFFRSKKNNDVSDHTNSSDNKDKGREMFKSDRIERDGLDSKSWFGYTTNNRK